MGCGGNRSFGYYRYSSGECGGHHHDDYDRYGNSEFDEKMTVINKMYAEGIIDDMEYQIYKQRAYDSSLGFEELMDMRMRRSNRQRREEGGMYGENSRQPQPRSEYKEKIENLKTSKQKIEEVKNKLSERIRELNTEKEKMESLAETVLKSSEDRAEEFIAKKLDIQGSILSLQNRERELQSEIEDVDSMIKSLETKELELEALKLQEELANFKTSFKK